MDVREFEALDQMIRVGRTRQVRMVLSKLENVPSASRARVASLWRRVGRPLESVRLLNSIVRPRSRSPSEASELEKAEYAAGLLQIGATHEAGELLRTLDGARVPQVHLFNAFACFARWDYPAALPSLRAYVEHPAIQGYVRWIGKVNLAAALVQARVDDEAEILLAELIEGTRADPELARLRANSLEILAQARVFAGRLAEAQEALEDSSRILRDAQLTDSLYVEKWRIVARLHSEGPTSSNRDRMRELQARARALGDAETVRDCDRHLAVVAGDSRALAHLYYGTPFETYRRQLRSEGRFEVPDEHSWQLSPGEPGAGGARAIDVFEELKPGQAMHRALAALSSDFYRPQTTAGLHARVFEGRHFSPHSSPDVVHQLVRRLRAWLGDRAIPIRVVDTGHGYRLAAAPGRSVALRIRARSLEGPETSIDRLRDRLEEPHFTRAAVAAALGCSERTAGRLLQEAVASGKFVREGSGSGTRYSWAR